MPYCYFFFVRARTQFRGLFNRTAFQRRIYPGKGTKYQVVPLGNMDQCGEPCRESGYFENFYILLLYVLFIVS